MRYVSDPEIASKLPSRSGVAMFRLIAFVRLIGSSRPPDSQKHVLLVDHHQTRWEAWLAGGFVFVSTAIYLTDLLSKILLLPVALFLSIPLASILIQVAILLVASVVTPMIRRLDESRRPDANSMIVLAVHLGLSIFMLRGNLVSRACAAALIVFYAVNLAAWCINLFLRKKIFALESQFIREGHPSAG